MRLEGVWYGALRRPETRLLELPCTVTGLGDAVVARDAFAALSLPATFEGQVSVRLAGAANRAAIEGGPVHSAFAVDGENRVAASRVALQREMQLARRTLGVVVELHPGNGLRVSTWLAKA